MNESTSAGLAAPIGNLESSLDRLESALADATDAVSTLRASLPNIEALAEVVRAMESAMSLAQEHLGSSPSATSVTRPQFGSTPSRRSEPPPAPAPIEISREQPSTSAWPASEEHAAPATASHFLQLRVECRKGPLDLKTVDAAVGEQPGVVDVALLEYDGRHAVLQIWTADEDPAVIGEALLESLHRRLGGEEGAQVEIEVQEAA